MTAKNTLSTSQVSALTSVSMATLKRYVKLYGSHFSETARQSKRGRRWTQADVENVILINRVSITRVGTKKINELLDQDIETKQQNLLTANQVLEIAVNVLTQVDDQRREIAKMIQTAGWNRIDYIKFAKEHDRQIKIIMFQLDKHMDLLQTIGLKLGYHKTRNKDFDWVKKAADRFEEWFKINFPEEYRRVMTPEHWLDSIQKYQAPESEDDDDD